MRAVAVATVLAVLSAGLAQAAPTQTARVVFTAKDWTVRRILWSDGVSACLAAVTKPHSALTLWADNRHPLRLEVYDDHWHFRARHHAVSLRVDARPPFRVAKADLFLRSVFFDLPKGPASARFLSDLQRGKTVRLLDDQGKPLRAFSLAGAGAALAMLDHCAAGLGKSAP